MQFCNLASAPMAILNARNLKLFLLLPYFVMFAGVHSALTREHQLYRMNERLATDIASTMSCRHISGLSVTVVQSGTTLMARGFGQARIDVKTYTPTVAGSKEPVKSSSRRPVISSEPCTADTKFAIASLSKAFTAALIGILLKENESRFPRRWDTRVLDVMGPDFRLADSIRTNQTSIRDLLAHRTGLPGYKMALMAGLDPSRSRMDYCLSMRFMKLDESGTTTFRNNFDYSNLMYMVVGCMAEVMSGGQSLETLMKEKLFVPLGMLDTHIISELNHSDTRFANMYLLDDETNSLQELDKYIVRTVMPLDAAGGVITTALDMVKWMNFQLNQGRTDSGQQLLPVQYWMQMHKPQVSMGNMMLPIHKPWFPIEDSYTTYGLGWRLGSYREHTKSEHSGRLAGFESKLTLLHSDRLGVFTVSNGPVYHGKDLHSVLHYLIVDTVLNTFANGSAVPWLNETTRCTFPEPWLSALSTSVPDRPLPAAEPHTTKLSPPDGWLDKTHALYVGDYHHKLLGFFNVTYSLVQHGTTSSAAFENDRDGRTLDNASISHSGGQLRFRSGSVGEGHLDYVNGVMWMMVFDGPLAYFGRTGPYRHYPLPIEFRGEQDNLPFTTVAVIPYEPLSPPLYKRVGTSNSASTTSATLLATFASAGLALMIAGSRNNPR